MASLGSFLHNLPSFSSELSRLWTSFVRLFYPANCIFCHEALELDEQNYACKTCVERLPTLKKPLCVKCAGELPPYGPLGPMCNRCLREKTYYKRGISIFRYEDTIKHLIQKVKFGKKSWYLKAVARFLKYAETPLEFSKYDLIVPVPLDSSRARTREFNQSLLFAKLLKKEQKVRAPVKNILRKAIKTRPQSALHRDERITNLQNAFRLRNHAKISGMNILLVDDVMTTGSTLNECAKCLREAGARRVDMFTLSRTTHQ